MSTLDRSGLGCCLGSKLIINHDDGVGRPISVVRARHHHAAGAGFPAPAAYMSLASGGNLPVQPTHRAHGRAVEGTRLVVRHNGRGEASLLIQLSLTPLSVSSLSTVDKAGLCSYTASTCSVINILEGEGSAIGVIVDLHE